MEVTKGLRRIRLADGSAGLVAVTAGGVHLVSATLDELLAGSLDQLHHALDEASSRPALVDAGVALAPVQSQEVWAAGVTYDRSRQARVEESTVKDVYDLVFEAERPEIFMKSSGWRVPEPGAPLRIRSDSTWDVPEPELALVVTATGELAGYLVADDLSSRSIEGQNPLYLAQAKIFDDAVGLSDTIVLARTVGRAIESARIDLRIERGGSEAFAGHTSIASMKRSFSELIGYLFRELSHPSGVVLCTGTGLVPPDEFTLEHGDEVEIIIEGVGRLRHSVYRSEGGAV